MTTTEKPTCKVIGRDGNIFAIMGAASKALSRAGKRDESKKMCDEVTASKSYDEALTIIQKYVDLE